MPGPEVKSISKSIEYLHWPPKSRNGAYVEP